MSTVVVLPFASVPAANQLRFNPLRCPPCSTRRVPHSCTAHSSTRKRQRQLPRRCSTGGLLVLVCAAPEHGTLPLDLPRPVAAQPLLPIHSSARLTLYLVTGVFFLEAFVEAGVLTRVVTPRSCTLNMSSLCSIAMEKDGARGQPGDLADFKHIEDTPAPAASAPAAAPEAAVPGVSDLGAQRAPEVGDAARPAPKPAASATKRKSQ